MEGRTISHFRVGPKIGEGGMGEVYRAEDLKLGRSVALKVLPPHLVENRERASRFLKEARAAAAVTHPSIAAVYEIDEAEGVTFIAMELVEGKNLRSMLGGQALPLRDAVRIATGVAEGLAAAHGSGIIHRDLKPENVIVGKDGHVRIIDFGLARLLEPDRPAATSESAATRAVGEVRTEEGKVLGTPAYMSPEQARGLKVDSRSDIFSFGSTLYEMVTGHSPFKGKTSTDTLSQILTRDPVPTASLNPDVPSSIQWILDKCLEKDPDQRYQDTRDLVVDLQHLHSRSGPFASQTHITPAALPALGTAGIRGLRRWAVPLAAAGVLLAAALLVLPLIRGRGPGAGEFQPNSLAVFSFENLKDPADPERLGQILQELLITDLSGNDPVKVFSSQRLHDIRKQLYGSAQGAADTEHATEIAARAGAQNMLTGSLSRLGDRWILTTQLADVRHGTVLQSKRIDGTELYGMVDELTNQILVDLPVSVPDLPEEEVPLRDRAASLGAFKEYLDGVDLLNNEQYADAIGAFQRAVDQDADFGQAYYQLAIAKWWAAENLEAAQEPLNHLLGRALYTSEKEKRMAEAALAIVAHKWGEGLTAFEQLAEKYPEEKEVLYGLGEALFHFPGGGRGKDGVAAFERALALDPDFTLAYHHIFDLFGIERRFEEAAARARDLVGRNPRKPIFHRYLAAALEASGDAEAAERATRKALEVNTSPGERQDLYVILAGAAGARFDIGRQQEYLEKAIQAAPERESRSLRFQLVEAFSQQRKFEELEDYVLREIEKDPYDGDLIDLLFDKHRREWRLDERLATAERLVRERPDDPQWYLRVHEYALALGDGEKADRALREARKRNRTPDDLRGMYESLGRSHEGIGDARRAEEYFRKALETDPEHVYPDILLSLGFLGFFRGDEAGSEEFVRKALEASPRHGGALFGMMAIHLEKEEFDAAIEYAKKILEIFPRSTFGYGCLIYANLRARRLREADEILETAFSEKVTLNGRYTLLADGFLGAGRIYLAAGEHDRAERAFQRAADLDPEWNFDALDGLGITHLARGEPERAEEFFRRMVDKNPRHADGLRGLAEARLARNDPAGAEAHVRRQMELGPVDSWSFELLAHALAGQGRFEEAREIAEGLVEKSPHRVTHECLAWLLVAGELDLDKGIEAANRALELPPDFLDSSKTLPHRPPAEHSLGLAYLKKREPARAVEYLEKAAAARPLRKSIQADLDRARAALARQ